MPSVPLILLLGTAADHCSLGPPCEGVEDAFIFVCTCELCSSGFHFTLCNRSTDWSASEHSYVSMLSGISLCICESVIWTHLILCTAMYGYCIWYWKYMEYTFRTLLFYKDMCTLLYIKNVIISVVVLYYYLHSLCFCTHSTWTEINTVVMNFLICFSHQVFSVCCWNV